ncbi:MAG: hypothetical protein QNJ51_24950 [Calothrix sp. MO_167.B12]|nr:hypothetical protein [Calothrix sp. MO_167.B12]
MTKSSKLDGKLVIEILSLAIYAATAVLSYSEFTDQKPQVIRIEEPIIVISELDPECDLYCSYFYF